MNDTTMTNNNGLRAELVRTGDVIDFDKTRNATITFRPSGRPASGVETVTWRTTYTRYLSGNERRFYAWHFVSGRMVEAPASASVQVIDHDPDVRRSLNIAD